MVGWDSSIGIATLYEVDGSGSNLGGDEIFRTCPDPSWGSPCHLYIGYGVSFPKVKWLGRGLEHPLPSSAEVKERVENYTSTPPLGVHDLF